VGCGAAQQRGNPGLSPQAGAVIDHAISRNSPKKLAQHSFLCRLSRTITLDCIPHEAAGREVCDIAILSGIEAAPCRRASQNVLPSALNRCSVLESDLGQNRSKH
jgi:hypothetical protein